MLKKPCLPFLMQTTALGQFPTVVVFSICVLLAILSKPIFSDMYASLNQLSNCKSVCKFARMRRHMSQDYEVVRKPRNAKFCSECQKVLSSELFCEVSFMIRRNDPQGPRKADVTELYDSSIPNAG